jgi:hypothetical protein
MAAVQVAPVHYDRGFSRLWETTGPPLAGTKRCPGMKVVQIDVPLETKGIELGHQSIRHHSGELVATCRCQMASSLLGYSNKKWNPRRPEIGRIGNVGTDRGFELLPEVPHPHGREERANELDHRVCHQADFGHELCLRFN